MNPDSDPVVDPLAGVPAPDVDAMAIPLDKNGDPYLETIDDKVVAKLGSAEVDSGTGLPTGSTVLTLPPGYYPGGINISSSGTKIVLTGGDDAVYAFGGGTKGKNGLVLTGGTFVAIGVMCYVTGDPDGSHPAAGEIDYGTIDIGGNAIVQLSSRGDEMIPPDIEGEMGIALWQDRDNPEYGKIIGNGNIDIDGTIYCGYNAMEVGGTADQTGSQLIAGLSICTAA